MNDVNSAARSFFVIAETSRLLSLGHERNLDWDYEIKANTIDGQMESLSGMSTACRK